MTMLAIDLEGMAAQFGEAEAGLRRRVIICAGTGCVANGALEVHAAFMREFMERGIEATTTLTEANGDTKGKILVSESGCQGFCQMGPLVTIQPEGYLYVHVKAEDVSEIVEKTIIGETIVERLLYVDPSTHATCKGAGDIPFYTRQSRTVLKECGLIDPGSIEEYVRHGGYESARKAYRDLTPKAVCDLVKAAGLRGRGGGGFPTGRKWELTLAQPGPKKYVICNGDEGDPGAFMDRSVMEGNPHSVLEGIMVAARAIGADEAYVYVRAEYPLAVTRVRKAVADAESAGILGEDVFGSRKSLHIHVMEGAGAFVCGEETALIASIEGKRGMPSPKPPFPAQSGLWGKPTVINNVETLASIPLILRIGAEKFASIGTKASPGTKTFALTGHVANTGLIEVPFGTTLREIVYNIGGGVVDAAGNPCADGFKAVQIGGPSGGCLTAEHLDLPLDFDSLRGVGAMVGSGGLVVLNNRTCMVSIAHFFMQFTQQESCGKCVLCREGTKQMLALLGEIMDGTATEQTLILLKQLALTVQKGSLCGLGKTAPSPVLSTMRYFWDEYEAHVLHKRCPAGQCKALLGYAIKPELCVGCGLCAKRCPVQAISGVRKEPYLIDQNVCIKCGACVDSCKRGAVVRS